jgi:hypothetical protein
LIVPHVLSFGGIEQGVKRQLDGLEYAMTPQGLIPDPRIAQWVLESASESLKAPGVGIPATVCTSPAARKAL